MPLPKPGDQEEREEFIKVPLHNGHVALIDAGDWPLIAWRQWFSVKRRNCHYAVCNSPNNIIYMHRLLCPETLQIDHINHDGLDNRRCNLRSASGSLNTHNQRKIRGKSSYLGVAWSKCARKWMAQINGFNRHYYLGLFSREEEAARARDIKAIELFGADANLNFRVETS